ncbi:unnamed protein product [Chironomus riparius]|uniref:Uncharacterized protein n=1 Tax=Chironomus riparius TaxID=315576 RepID=A0A9N9WJ05_9DIPT|nr:unnamed protein product [Chironomus riparius]
MEIVGLIQNAIIKALFNILLVITLVKGLGQTTDQEPEFLQPLDNLTVTQGRDVSFTCVVNNLGQYRKLAKIITEVIKFYQAHIFPNWIQHLLYGERSSPNLFVLNKNSTTTTSTAAEGMKLTIKCETYVIDYYL